MESLPLRAFRYRSDAESTRRALLASGIASVVREGADAPAGGRIHPDDLPFTLWVPVDRFDEARRVVGEIQPRAPEDRCSCCGASNPHVHVTLIMEGRQTIRHYCEKCYGTAGSTPSVS